MDKMSRVTDRAMEYMLKEFNAFLVHSENKKPYKSTTYEDMEYGLDPISFNPWRPPHIPIPQFPAPPPIPYTPTPEDPGPPDPGPTPTPTPGPTPGPTPLPTPPPSPSPDWTCRGCMAYDFEFCPDGPCVEVPIWDYCPIDPIVSGGPWFGRDDEGFVQGGRNPVYCPGASTSVHLSFTTKNGGICSARGRAKDPDLCKGCDGTGSIGYTTTGMQVNETQQLTSTCGVGPGGNCNATWSITGGGSITSGGLYTAPASNANCTNNPVITLLCGSKVVATLGLAINGSSSGAYAGFITCCQSNSVPIGGGRVQNFGSIIGVGVTCSGAYIGSLATCTGPFDCTYSGQQYCTDCDICAHILSSHCYSGDPCFGVCTYGGFHDLRTTAMLLDGCCPAQAL